LKEKNMERSINITSKLISEDTLKEVEGLFFDFKKLYTDFDELKFLINGDEYFMYRCIKKPNRHVCFVSNKEQFDWWNGDGTSSSGMKWSTGFERPRGLFTFGFENIKNPSMRKQTSGRMCRKFLDVQEYLRDIEEEGV
jgi:hypothetical protein